MPARSPLQRPHVRGRFLFHGDNKIWVRGVTYGTFRPDATGHQYGRMSAVARDFEAMAENGVNAIRTYTVPPRWLLDAAYGHGIQVLVGLPWEQHVAFLDDRRRARTIATRVRVSAALCAGHPAVLGYAVGNEIPAPVVRWHGARRVERFIERLTNEVREVDPGALVTYINYPSTEYLELPFVDFVCFNVYLEAADRLSAYLARLHNLAGDRPLLLGEVGLDSRRNGEACQAAVLDWELRTAFSSGCAGAFVFAWTDEWHRGGDDIEDWDFGLTNRRREPKPALAAVRQATTELPFAKCVAWPRMSVVVCSYNGARTIRDTLNGLVELDYPDLEVIVVDDGSTDDTALIAREYPVRVISTPNRGLSNARNTGLRAATGEIVAYIDDDAWPDPDWLRYVAWTFLTSDHVAVGGPNLPPPGDGLIADAVALSPGGPIHVLLTDREAEHVPGCNMAFKKSALEAIGGFDPRFRTAGDDVDVCWRLTAREWTIGFHPAALVWHHRRNSIRTYWKQQAGYGRAEALLAGKWPEKHNGAGHASWSGRLYGPGRVARLLQRGRIYQGSWGTALFQSLYERTPGPLTSFLSMPEWWFVVPMLAVLGLLGFEWTPLRTAWPLFGLALGAPLARAIVAARRAHLPIAYVSPRDRVRLRSVIALLHVLQPIARLVGRVKHGLTLWRRRGVPALVTPRARTVASWSEHWRAPTERLAALESWLREQGQTVVRGGDWDRWDLELRQGWLAAARLLAGTEEHGRGRQLTRFRVWPRWSRFAVASVSVTAGLAVGATAAHAWFDASLFAAGAVGLVLRALTDYGGAAQLLNEAIHELATDSETWVR